VTVFGNRVLERGEIVTVFGNRVLERGESVTVFGNRVLENVCGYKNMVTREIRKLHDE